MKLFGQFEVQGIPRPRRLGRQAGMFVVAPGGALVSHAAVGRPLTKNVSQIQNWNSQYK